MSPDAADRAARPAVPSEEARGPRRLDVGLSLVLAGVFLALAYANARAVTEGVASPHDIDHFRDIASAQSILDGCFPADPAYRGETIWYNPLLPAAVAAFSRLTGEPVERSHVLAGPVFNLASAAAFYGLVLLLAGPWPAVLALASLLFAPPHGEVTYGSPTYSPWLYANTFGLLFFCLGLMLCHSALRRRSRQAWLALGAVLGLALLAHTTPFLILGCCGLSSVFLASRHPPPTGPAPRSVPAWQALLLVTLSAAVVGAPLLYSILGRYGLRNLNAVPNTWIWPPTSVHRLPDLLLASINVKNGLAVLGIGIVLRGARSNPAYRLLLVFLAGVLALFAYGLANEATDFAVLPPLVPNHHAYVHLQLAGHAFVGVAAWGCAMGLLTLLSRGVPTGAAARRLRWLLPPVLALLTALGVKALWADYRLRLDFTQVREMALHVSRVRATVGLVAALRQHTAHGEAVLAGPLDAAYYVVPANRQVILVPQEISNPFVDYDARRTLHGRLWATFFSSDFAAFLAQARTHHITAVLLDRDGEARFRRSVAAAGGLTEVFRTADRVLLRLPAE